MFSYGRRKDVTFGVDPCSALQSNTSSGPIIRHDLISSPALYMITDGSASLRDHMKIRRS